MRYRKLFQQLTTDRTPYRRFISSRPRINASSSPSSLVYFPKRSQFVRTGSLKLRLNYIDRFMHFRNYVSNLDQIFLSPFRLNTVGAT